ncbi:MAG: hypothetical protein ACLTSX_08700 [Collinsella sp.]
MMTVRLVIAMIVGAASAALAGFVIGIPVLRLSRRLPRHRDACVRWRSSRRSSRA